MVDQHLRRRLAVPVDAAIALFEACRRERDLDVHHAVAVALQVDAFAGSVGGQEDAQGKAVGRVLELALDPLSGFCIHTAVQECEPLPAEPAGSEQLLQPRLGVPVLGEHDDPLVVPMLARCVERRTGGLQPVEQPQRLGVRSAFGPSGPALQPAQQVQLLIV